MLRFLVILVPLVNPPIATVDGHKLAVNVDNTLEVDGNFYIGNTNFSKKYTKEEIRKMCPGIKGDIIK